MSDMHIRLAEASDRTALADLFHALWPKGPVEEHSRELEAILSGKAPGLCRSSCSAEAGDRSLLGFLEVGFAVAR